jgi:anaerobic selenocysteine-containing dehydrogenase
MPRARQTRIMDDGAMNFREHWRDYWSPKETVDTSPKISDEVKYTTCYMCACRCGIVRDHAALFAGAPVQAAAAGW